MIIVRSFNMPAVLKESKKQESYWKVSVVVLKECVSFHTHEAYVDDA